MLRSGLGISTCSSFVSPLALEAEYEYCGWQPHGSGVRYKEIDYQFGCRQNLTFQHWRELEQEQNRSRSQKKTSLTSLGHKCCK